MKNIVLVSALFISSLSYANTVVQLDMTLKLSACDAHDACTDLGERNIKPVVQFAELGAPESGTGYVQLEGAGTTFQGVITMDSGVGPIFAQLTGNNPDAQGAITVFTRELKKTDLFGDILNTVSDQSGAYLYGFPVACDTDLIYWASWKAPAAIAPVTTQDCVYSADDGSGLLIRPSLTVSGVVLQ